MVNYHVSRRYRKAWIPCKSWRAFAVDNKLNAGDICVFELIKGNIGILLDVAIFSATDTASSSSKSGE